jgi:CheY-like chemotaxis protein
MRRNRALSSLATLTVVLVVEDEGLLRYAIAEALREAGFDVLESGTADHAITRLAAADDINVVFTDIQTPGQLSGWDVAEQFRAANADVMILYTSGNSLDRSRRVAGSLFFDKPHDVPAVVKACGRRLVEPVTQDGDGDMQHYFLHVRNGSENIEDIEGAKFVDLASAEAEAIEGARELISQCVLAGRPMGLKRFFEIVDSAGETVAKVQFADAIASD